MKTLQALTASDVFLTYHSTLWRIVPLRIALVFLRHHNVYSTTHGLYLRDLLVDIGIMYDSEMAGIAVVSLDHMFISHLTESTKAKFYFGSIKRTSCAASFHRVNPPHCYSSYIRPAKGKIRMFLRTCTSYIGRISRLSISNPGLIPSSLSGNNCSSLSTIRQMQTSHLTTHECLQRTYAHSKSSNMSDKPMPSAITDES